MKKTKMLKKNYEFRYVLKKGESFYGKYVITYVLKNKFGKNLLGLAVGTKVGKAYQRNRIKRLIRESYKVLEDEIKEGYTILFLVNRKDFDYKELTFDKIKNDIEKIFRKSKLI